MACQNQYDMTYSHLTLKFGAVMFNGTSTQIGYYMPEGINKTKHSTMFTYSEARNNV